MVGSNMDISLSKGNVDMVLTECPLDRALKGAKCQCQLLNLARSSFDYQPQPPSHEE
jgi:hypothetical protein